MNARLISMGAPLRDGIPTPANGSRRRPTVTSLRSSIVLALLVSACGGPVTGGDDGGRADGQSIQLVCVSDAQCADDRFCNGAERCAPDAPGADSRGCLLGGDPCPGQRCEEAAAACSSCEVADADGDGHDDIGCGGDDCDDTDAQRFPGNVEVCDATDRDEDCDPDTVGADADEDGEAPSECCNTIAGALRCGTDCDDTRATINSDAIEVCNGLDEDCDATLDEGVPHSIFPDDDGDGFGRTRDGVASCTLPASGGFSFIGGDCDDDDASLNPRNVEECNDIDDDCDTAIDEGCPCEPGEARPCGLRDPDGFVEIGGCHSGDQICRERVWSSCIMASIPEEERCNHVDDDCDGDIDEGQTVLLYIDEDGDGAGDAGEPRRSCGVLAGYVRTGGDCDDSRAAISPTASEACNLVDDDCDGTVDEGLPPDCGACTDGATRPCTTACGAGIETCSAGAFGGCTAPAPMIEACNDLDDDCNGSADDGIAPRACSTACGSGTETCSAGSFTGCTAPPVLDELCNNLDDDCDGTVDDGVTRGCSSTCGSGIETCSMGAFGACTAPAPMPETCNNADDDCDGAVDDGLTRSCSTACGTGTETCSMGVFGGCTARAPSPETCNNVDDNCNGSIDDGVTRACSTACGSGIETCSAGSFGGCTARTPSPETCNNMDDNCNGSVDDGLTRACSSACGTGIETCSAGSYGGCTAPTGPCDLTPTMTGYTTPSGTVTSSGEYSGYSAWYAFDSTSATATGDMWLSALNVAPAWVAYEFSAPRTVTEYGVRYTNGTLTSRAPRDWQFQGFNGTSWVTLDTRAGQTGWTSGQVRTFAIGAPAPYRSYRLYITEDNDGSATIVVVSIGELFMTGY